MSAMRVTDDLDDLDDRGAFGEGAGSLSLEVSAGYAVWGWGRLCGAEERRAMGAESEACLSPKGELPSGPPATEHRKAVAKRPPQRSLQPRTACPARCRPTPTPVPSPDFREEP